MLWGWGRGPSGLHGHLGPLPSQCVPVLSVQFVASMWNHRLLLSAEHLGQRFLLFPCHLLGTGLLLLLSFHVGAPRMLGGGVKRAEGKVKSFSQVLPWGRRGGSPCYPWIPEASGGFSHLPGMAQVEGDNAFCFPFSVFFLLPAQVVRMERVILEFGKKAVRNFAFYSW